MWHKTNIPCPDCNKKLYRERWNSHTDIITCLNYRKNGRVCLFYRKGLTRAFLGLPPVHNPKHKIAFDGRYRLVEQVLQSTYTSRSDRGKQDIIRAYRNKETVIYIPTDCTAVIIDRKKIAPSYMTSYQLSLSDNGNKPRRLWCFAEDIKHMWEE